MFQYSEAKRDVMKEQIENIDWPCVSSTKNVDEQIDYFTDFLLDLMQQFIPTKWITGKCARTPWLCKDSWKSILEKRNAEGTEDYGRKQRECNDRVHEDYCKYIECMKKKVEILSKTRSNGGHFRVS